MRTVTCAACGAPVAPGTRKCPFCGSYFEPGEQARPQAANDSLGGLVLERQTEPNEGAFSLSVPMGWQIEGGIFRADLMNRTIDAQSILPKLDFAVKGDDVGRVQIRWLPEVRYCDLRGTPVGGMGMFPPGSTYQGMTVSPAVSAVQFLTDFCFPWAHPHASQARVVEQQALPQLAQAYQQRTAGLGVPLHVQYDGGMVLFAYQEGIHYLERAQTIVENLGPMAAGMWSNKDTVLMRSPENEFDKWLPILQHIRESVTINQAWLAQEIVNEEILNQSFLNAQQAAMARERRMLEVQQQMQAMDRQMTEHRMRTNAEIHNDAYLTLMELEEFKNPHTGDVDIGSNQWEYRWVTADGAEFYTDREEADPNIGGLLNHDDWKRTPVRPRFPQ